MKTQTQLSGDNPKGKLIRRCELIYIEDQETGEATVHLNLVRNYTSEETETIPSTYSTPEVALEEARLFLLGVRG